MIVLTDQEREEFLDILKWYEKEVSHNKKLAKEVLIGAGMMTKNGNIKKAYKHICIPQGQA